MQPPPPPPEQNGPSGMQVLGGAALAGGVVVGAAAGSLLLGAAGAGAAAYAATRDDKVGDAAKATGKATLTGIDKAKEFDQKHKVTATAGNWFQQGLNNAKEFNAKHNVTGKVASGIESGMNQVNSALGGGSAKPATAPPPSAPQVAAVGGLPAGWQAVSTPDGRVYFWNQASEATTWERPM